VTLRRHAVLVGTLQSLSHYSLLGLLERIAGTLAQFTAGFVAAISTGQDVGAAVGAGNLFVRHRMAGCLADMATGPNFLAFHRAASKVVREGRGLRHPRDVPVLLALDGQTGSPIEAFLLREAVKDM
jgi:hypothetical protein